MSIFQTLRVSMSGLTAQRLRMDVISSNIANVDTTRTPAGGPYQRRQVVFSAAPAVNSQHPGVLRASTGLPGGSNSVGEGVAVSRINVDTTAVREVYDPTHPDADANGNVLYPDIDIVTEMTDMMSATRAYEANVTVLNAAKDLAMRALGIGRA